MGEIRKRTFEEGGTGLRKEKTEVNLTDSAREHASGTAKSGLETEQRVSRGLGESYPKIRFGTEAKPKGQESKEYGGRV